MNAVAANVVRQAEKVETDAGRSFKVVALFCGIGLAVSLWMASLGFDVSAGFY